MKGLHYIKYIISKKYAIGLRETESPMQHHQEGKPVNLKTVILITALKFLLRGKETIFVYVYYLGPSVCSNLIAKEFDCWSIIMS